MLLNLIILLICVNKIFSEESEEGKYIDLLPDDEKREFLEKVARRILEEVESKDSMKKSGELSDSQLNKHSAYVSKIMKEEQDDLTKKYNNNTNLKKKDVRSDDPVIEEQDKKEDGERKESGEKGEHEQYIDLTLRQGKASIREHDSENLSVADKLYANDKPLLGENTIVAKTKDNTKPIESTSKTEALVVEDKKKDDNISIEILIDSLNKSRNPEFSNYNLKSSSNINIPVQVVYDSAQNGYKEHVNINLAKNETNTQTTTENAKLDRGGYIYQSQEKNAQNYETRKTVTVMENYEPKKCWTSEESLSTSKSSKHHKTTTRGNVVTDESNRVVTNCDGKPIKYETTSQWIIVDPPDVTGGIYESIDITRSKKTNNTDQVMIENGIITTTGASMINSDTDDTTIPITDVANSTQVDTPVNNTNAVKVDEKSTIGVLINKTNDVTKPETYTSTIEPIAIGITATVKYKISEQENPENKSLISKKSQNQNDKSKILISTSILPENQFKALNLKISSVETQLENSKINLVELESKYNKIKELKVYEIPSGKPLFVKTDVPKETVLSKSRENGEQPNYVPIYNYSPNNAYFNAYNRLGPNYEENEGNINNDPNNDNILRTRADSSISFESRERINKHYYFYNSAPSLKKIRSKILLPPSMPKSKQKNYHSKIYLDDYSDTEVNGFFRKKKKMNKYTRYGKNKFKKYKKHKENDDYDDSLHVDDMYARGTIKNHVEAVRHYLSKKHHFNYYDPIREKEKENAKKKAKEKNKKKNRYKGENEKKDENKNSDKNKDNDNGNGYDNGNDNGNDNNKDSETPNISKEDSNVQKETSNESPGDKDDENENKNKKLRTKLKKMLRAQKESRMTKSKLNWYPKTRPEPDFHNKPSEYEYGIDLDYYFSRSGRDLSSSSSREVSFSSSEKSSLEKGHINIGNLGSINNLESRENYDAYRRKANSGKVDNTIDGNGSKYTMADLNLVKTISEASGLVNNVLMMQKIVGLRSGSTNNLNYYLNVLSDMIQMDNKALLQYDWLGSAVDIQSALTKLIDLTEQLNDGDFDVHPADWELFKYVFYIYETVDLDVKKKSQLKRKMIHADTPEKSIEGEGKNERLSKFFPKMKKAAKGGSKKMKKFAPYFSLRAQINLYEEKMREKQKLLKNILDFHEFLLSARDELNDLHEAIKHIGMVSKQNTVKWFKNLKELYLNKPSQQELLSVLLHLSLNRVINLIEESTKEGVERSFVSYVRRERNALKIQRTKQEISFVLSILKELENLEN